MPGCFRQVPGGIVGYESYIVSPPPLLIEGSTLWDRRWMYQRRSPDTVPQWDQTFVATGAWWPMVRTGAWSGDLSTTYFSEDTMGHLAGAYAAWEYGLGGSKSAKYIMGKCQDQNSVALGGAVVQCFKTVGDQYIGEIACDDKGNYEVMCPNTPTDQHYLVAYYDAGTDLAGTTVNTLVPTWRDGTV